MTETNLSLAYRALISSHASSKTRILDSSDVASVAKSFGFAPNVVLNGLVRGGYLVPVYFSGVYYLPDPDERDTKFLKRKSYEMVAAACLSRFGKNWYYGLGSALYIAGLTHQTPYEFFVITDRHDSASFEFGGNRFRIRKSSVNDYVTGVEERGLLRFSAPARTITDYLYFYSKEGRQDHAIRTARGILRAFPKARIGKRLIDIYPAPYNLAVAYCADAASGGHV
jgi:predicted transcriptional regulator of viral defense system